MFNVFSFFFSLCVLLWWWKQNKEKRKTKKYYDICRLFFVSYFFLFLAVCCYSCRSLLLIFSFCCFYLSIFLIDISRVTVVTLTKFRSVCDIAWPLTFFLSIRWGRPWISSPIGPTWRPSRREIKKQKKRNDHFEEIKGPALAVQWRENKNEKKNERKKRPGACAIYDRRLFKKKRREIR